jgi:hypothetical protein
MGNPKKSNDEKHTLLQPTIIEPKRPKVPRMFRHRDAAPAGQC